MSLAKKLEGLQEEVALYGGVIAGRDNPAVKKYPYAVGFRPMGNRGILVLFKTRTDAVDFFYLKRWTFGYGSVLFMEKTPL